jgi:hypothetical protein
MKLFEHQQKECLEAVVDVVASFFPWLRPPHKAEFDHSVHVLNSLFESEDCIGDRLHERLKTRKRQLETLKVFNGLIANTDENQKIVLLRELYRLALCFPETLTTSEGSLSTGAFYIGIPTVTFFDIRDEIRREYMPPRLKDPIPNQIWSYKN